MKLSKYEKYKDIGIAWLGSLPSHWEVKRNKNIFYEVSNLSKTGKETLLTVSHITGVTPRSEKNVNMFFAETMEGYKICKQGDLIINTMWAWMGALGTSKYFGICSPAYNVYRNLKGVSYNPEYFEYLFRTPNSIMEMTRYSKGIVSSRLRLYPKDFYQILSPVPPLNEQNAIVNYLNKNVAKIERKVFLLQEKQRCYVELRKSLVNETICQGIDKAVELTDNDYDTVGKHPIHWKIKRLKDLVTISTGGRNSEDFDENGTYPFYVRSPNILRINTYAFNEEAILTPGDGDIGKVFHYVKGKFDVHQRVYCIRKFKKEISARFLYYYLSAKLHDEAKRNNSNATVDSLRLPFFQNFLLPFPDIKEQLEFVSYLDCKTKTIDLIITNVQSQLDELAKLKTSLINDAVTGKVKINV